MVDAAAPSLWAKAWSKPATRWGSLIVGLILFAGIYAPFLANDVALVWITGNGISFPAVGDLFNRWSYPKYYDLYFNVAALVLPFLLLVGWLTRRYVSLGARIAWSCAAIVGIGSLCMLPVIPSDQGWQAAWRHRPTTDLLITAPRSRAVALSAPIPFRATTPVSGQVLKPPLSVDEASGRRFWLGTDSVGKDVAAQLLAGARISLTVGLVATGLSLAIGLLIGALSGYLGGWVDLILQRVVEIMMCFPTFILILVVVAMLSRDIFIIMTVIGVTGWAGTARLVRGEFLAQSVRDYVAASQALGLGSLRIMFRHILPNAVTPLLVTATFGIAGAVLSESSLSFVGLGDPTVASWGMLLEQGRQNIQYGWLIWLPGLAVFALVSALNLIGNGLRDALDTSGE